MDTPLHSARKKSVSINKGCYIREESRCTQHISPTYNTYVYKTCMYKVYTKLYWFVISLNIQILTGIGIFIKLLQIEIFPSIYK